MAIAREELFRRSALQGRAAALDAPAHLASLGEVPDGLAKRDRWETAATSVEAYRLEFGVDHPTAPLGDRQTDPKQLVAWREAQRDVGSELGAGRDSSRA